MRILLAKLTSDWHALEIERAGGQRERVELETRSCLLHDLTHLAVEEAAGIEGGFWGSLAAGRTIAEMSQGAAYTGTLLQVERTVAVLQGPAAAQEDPAIVHARILDLLAVQGASPPSWFTVPFVARVNERVRRLQGHWKATPFGGSMELTWEEAGSTRPA
jgi:hypothetical protein